MERPSCATINHPLLWKSMHAKESSSAVFTHCLGERGVGGLLSRPLEGMAVCVISALRPVFASGRFRNQNQLHEPLQSGTSTSRDVMVRPSLSAWKVFRRGPSQTSALPCPHRMDIVRPVFNNADRMSTSTFVRNCHTSSSRHHAFITTPHSGLLYVTLSRVCHTN